MIATLPMTLIYFTMNYVSTVKLPREFKQTMNNKKNLNNSNNINITLEMILSNETSIHLFMEHLSKEYVFCTCTLSMIFCFFVR